MSASSSNQTKEPNRSCYGRLLRRVKKDPPVETFTKSTGKSKNTQKKKDKTVKATSTNKNNKKHAIKNIFFLLLLAINYIFILFNK